jgi:hypothetical protein
LHTEARPVFKFYKANTRVSSRAVGLVLRSLGFLPSRTSAAAARDSFPCSVASVSPGLEIHFSPTAHVSASALRSVRPEEAPPGIRFSFWVSLSVSRADTPSLISFLSSRSASSRKPVLLLRRNECVSVSGLVRPTGQLAPTPRVPASISHKRRRFSIGFSRPDSGSRFLGITPWHSGKERSLTPVSAPPGSAVSRAARDQAKSHRASVPVKAQQFSSLSTATPCNASP